MEPEYPGNDIPQSSGFGKSAILFVVTMGTVFGLGMIWTNYGETIAFHWRRDWNGMKEDIAGATETAAKDHTNDVPLSALIPGHNWRQEFDQVSHELNSSRGGRRSSGRAVQPVIDTRRPVR